MEYNKLMKYMKAVVELEKEKIVISNLIRQLKNQSEQQKQNHDQKLKKYVCENEPRYPSMPSKPNLMSRMKEIGCGWWVVFFVIYLGFTPFMIIMWNVSFRPGYEVSHDLLLGILNVAFFGGIGVFLIPFIRAVIKYIKDKEDYPDRMKRYNDDTVLCDKDMVVYNRKLQQIKNQLADVELQLGNKINSLKEMYDKVDRLLQDYYALDIIPKGYRDFVPVCMFYDYLSSKRTYSLYRNPNGSDPGAINMYEDEKDRRIIMTKLDSIISNLKSIQVRQSYLYDAITDSTAESNRIMTSISQSLSDGNNALAYNNYLNEVNNAQNRYRNDLLTRMYYGY